MLVLGIDTETGGLNPVNNDLLSIGLVAYDTDRLEVRDMVELKVKGSRYRVELAAMKVNGIDLKEHNAQALEVPAAREAVETFKHCHWKDGEKAMLMGWNVHFDYDFFKQLYYGKAMDGRTFAHHWWDKNINHRVWDVQSMVQFWCSVQGNKPLMGLDETMNHLGIKPMGERHTALTDALAACSVYKELCRWFEDIHYDCTD